MLIPNLRKRIMITTVTVSTVTTVSTIAAMGLTAVVSGIAIVALIFFLATKELASAGNSGTSLRIARFSAIAIAPLLIAFAVVMTVKIFEVLA